MMVSNVARDLEQPGGGFLNPHAMEVFSLKTDDDLFPPEDENITGGEIGMVVDYLTRYQLTGNLEEAFEISLRGAERGGVTEFAQKSLKQIRGLDAKSIKAAVKLVSCDVFIRNPIGVLMGGWHPSSRVSDETVSNIQVMIKRCLQLFEEYGPVTIFGPVFPGAYTKYVDSGDADYATTDTIWDIKTTKKDISIQDTYQLLLYYLLSQHSDINEYRDIKRIGIYNPRLNLIHLISVSEIDKRIQNYVCKYVIGYEDTEDVTLKDLKEALDSRPKYPHYHSKRGTTRLMEQLIQLDFSDKEKLYIFRANKKEFIRNKLAECIEKEKLKTSEEVLAKEIELMKSYGVRPNQLALSLFK